MHEEEIVGLFFKFESGYYKRSRLERMVMEATKLAKKSLPFVDIKYKRIDIKPAGLVLEEIVSFIDSTSFCVFELSDNNPNVLFELGYALGKGKGIALLKKEGSKPHNPMPSDLEGLFILYYEDDETALDNLSPALSIHIEKNIRKNVQNKYEYILRRIWTFRDGQDVLFVNGNHRGQYVIFPPDQNALLESVLTVKTLYPNIVVNRFYAKDVPPGYIDINSVISIGGPRSNEVTKMYLDKINFPWEIKWTGPNDKPFIMNKKTNEIRRSQFDENGVLKKDIGFFIKIPNPKSVDKIIILIGALTTEGVSGTANTFSYTNQYTKLNCNKIMKLVDELNYFAVITETEVIDKNIVNKPLAKEMYIYNPSDITWEEIQIPSE